MPGIVASKGVGLVGNVHSSVGSLPSGVARAAGAEGRLAIKASSTATGAGNGIRRPSNPTAAIDIEAIGQSMTAPSVVR